MKGFWKYYTLFCFTAIVTACLIIFISAPNLPLQIASIIVLHATMGLVLGLGEMWQEDVSAVWQQFRNRSNRVQLWD